MRRLYYMLVGLALMMSLGACGSLQNADSGPVSEWATVLAPVLASLVGGCWAADGAWPEVAPEPPGDEPS